MATYARRPRSVSPTPDQRDGPVTKLYSPDYSFSIGLRIDHKDQEVFQPTSYPGNSSTGYVESRDGQQFGICFDDLRQAPQQALKVYFLVDGEVVRARTLDPHRVGHRQSIVMDVRESDISVRFLKFASVKVTDDASVAVSDPRTIEAAGSIEVRICRGDITGTSKSQSQSYKPLKKAPILHEKSKKARLSHVTEFGDATYAPSGTARTSMNMIDKLSNPGIVMKLRYRSRALLELEGVVQDPDAPVPKVPNSNNKKRPLIDGFMHISDDEDDDEEDGAQQRAIKRIKLEISGAPLETFVLEDDD